jgi:tRNA threonylcarbamoyl adenosine modification protein (Sua5/YciO/YrdC/YwlC family)
MSQYFEVHPENPQPRFIQQAVDIINKGGVVIYPTDSSYAIGCHLGDKKAMDRIRLIRQLDKNHNFTLVCRDLSEISKYAIVDNLNYRLMKSLTPGPYTFILPATREVPKRLLNPKRKTIGIRVPDNAVCSALLEELDQPLMSSTLTLPGEEYPLTDPYKIRLKLENMVDLIIDGGYSGNDATTVVSLTDEKPEIIRQGLGSADWLIQH